MPGLARVRIRLFGRCGSAKPRGGQIGQRGGGACLAPREKTALSPASRRASPVVRVPTSSPNPSSWRGRRAQPGVSMEWGSSPTSSAGKPFPHGAEASTEIPTNDTRHASFHSSPRPPRTRGEAARPGARLCWPDRPRLSLRSAGVTMTKMVGLICLVRSTRNFAVPAENSLPRVCLSPVRIDARISRL